jgi:type I restriction enzyme, S subunit
MTKYSTIPKGWKTTTLGDVVEFQRGFDLPTQDRIEGKYPLVASTGIDGYVKEFKVKCPGVITGRSGSLGKVLFIKEKFWPLNTTLWVKDFRGNDEKFIYYWLQNFPFEKYNAGTGVPTLNRNHIHQAEVIVTNNIEEQRAIAAVLSSFDDKIELLREQNKTLEATAQAIFKEWFVDFNFPFDFAQGTDRPLAERSRSQKESFKPYKTSGGKMVDSELGKIPEGWRVGKLEGFIKELISGEWGKDQPEEGYNSRVICLRGTDLPDLKYSNASRAPYRYIKEDKLELVEIKHNDLIVEISGGTIGQSTGRVAYFIEEIAKRNQVNYVASNFCKVLRLKDENLLPFIYFYWEYLYKTGLFFNFENGTTGIQNLNLKSFLKYELVFPEEKLIEVFCNLGKNILISIQNNNSQIQSLAILRDTLLPKLMKSGVRIKEFN